MTKFNPQSDNVKGMSSTEVQTFGIETWFDLTFSQGLGI
jgi:hypothetical protein